MESEKNFEFKLAPAYCILNKVAVSEQKGSKIVFMIGDLRNFNLRQKLEKAFTEYVSEIRSEKECADIFKTKAKIIFTEGTNEKLRRAVFKSCENQTTEEIEENYSQTKSIADFNRNSENDTENKYHFEDELFVAENEDLFSQNAPKDESEILLSEIIDAARKSRATDIHIEKNAIKFRIDGVLENYTASDLRKTEAIIQKIKIFAGLNVTEKRRIQEGRFSYGKKNPVFISVSVFPLFCDLGITQSLVLHLFDSENTPPKLEKSGFNENQLKKIRELERLKSGLILVCAPKNFEKSATLASVLSEIQKTGEQKAKIVSLENRPEYFIAEACQTEIENDFFSSPEKAFFHILSQDPDVISFGEINNEIKATVALRAALSGKLVLATLNCDSASAALTLLENCNLNRKLICSVLKGVICRDSDFVNGKKFLYADVCLPRENSAEKIKQDFSETQTEEAFLHYTNYFEILNETKKTLMQKSAKSAKESTEKKENLKTEKSRLFIYSNRKKNRKKIV